jgi:hypothetical protein
MEVLAFAVFIGLLLMMQARAETGLMFPDQTCGYCPMGIHWDDKERLWIHDNGLVRLPLPGSTRATHVALPIFLPTPY